jgi:hypothetical protein
MRTVFVAVASTPLAAATGLSAAQPTNASPGADTPFQSQDTPVDCKKKPEDPRCKNKPY